MFTERRCTELTGQLILQQGRPRARHADYKHQPCSTVPNGLNSIKIGGREILYNRIDVRIPSIRIKWLKCVVQIIRLLIGCKSLVELTSSIKCSSRCEEELNFFILCVAPGFGLFAPIVQFCRQLGQRLARTQAHDGGIEQHFQKHRWSAHTSRVETN